MRNEFIERERRLRLRISPRQGFRQYVTAHSSYLFFRFMNALALRDRRTEEEELPLIRESRCLPRYRNSIRIYLQFDIGRRHTFRQLLHKDLVDIVDGVCRHITYIFPDDGYHAFRTGVVLEISIATRISGTVQRKAGYRHEGIDIHRIRHDTDRSMSLSDIVRTAAEVELHLHAIEVLHHRQREPCVRTASFTQEETFRTAVSGTVIHSRIRSGIAEDTHTDST